MKKFLINTLIYTAILGLLVFYYVKGNELKTSQERAERKEALIQLCLSKLTESSPEFLADPRPDKAQINEDFNNTAEAIYKEYKEKSLTFAQVNRKSEVAFDELMKKYQLPVHKGTQNSVLIKEITRIEKNILVSLEGHVIFYKPLNEIILKNDPAVAQLITSIEEDIKTIRMAFYDYGYSETDTNKLIDNAYEKYKESFAEMAKLIKKIKEAASKDSVSENVEKK